MASCMISRSMRVGIRPQRRPALIARAQAGSAKVSFKVARHVDFGQSVVLVGSVPELGSWDAKLAVELSWSAGDKWSTSVALPARSSVEYKYIVKRKEGLDWCPGQNKAVVLPEAASVEISDSWDSPANSVTVLQPLDVPTATAAPTEAPAVAAPAAAVAAAPATAAPAAALQDLPQAAVAAVLGPEAAVVGSDGVPTDEAVAAAAAAAEAPIPINTVDNVQLAELTAAPPLDGAASGSTVPTFEETVFEPAATAAPHTSSPQQPQEGPGAFVAANNILAGPPMGAVPVSSDPISSYEEADKYEVVEVGPVAEKAAAEKAAATAVATEARPAAKSLEKTPDSMTVSQLKTELKRRGLSSFGNRRELINRLRSAGAL